MIYCINLPRSGGQTMLQALSDMFPKDGSVNMWHSVEPGRWGVVSDKTVALVEVYAPISWCVRSYATKPHRFVIARRNDFQSWRQSCLKMLPMAIERRWRHPLWSYDTSQWADYYFEFYDNALEDVGSYGVPFITIDPTSMTMQNHVELCEFLDVPVPREPWPNIDRFARLVPQSHPRDMALETSIINSWVNPLQF